MRIGLHLKGLACDETYVNLRTGEHNEPAFRAVSPYGRIPVLEHEGRVLTQSLAILEWLDELHPEPPLLPTEPLARARVRELALAVAADTHPLQNPNVRALLTAEFGISEEEAWRFCRIVIERGLAAVEAQLARDAETGRFCHGDAPTLADCVLVPQLYNAHRIGCTVEKWPTLLAIERACLAHAAFRRAAPEAQSDAPRS